MCTDDHKRAMTRARDDLECSLAQVSDLITTAAFAITHAGDDAPPTASIGGTLSAALITLARVEEAARTLAHLADRPPPAVDPIPLAGTRH